MTTDNDAQRTPDDTKAVRDARNEIAHERSEKDPRADKPISGPDDSGIGRDSHSLDRSDDKAHVIAHDAKSATTFAIRFIVIIAALALAGFLLKYLWVGLLPVILAILVSSVLFPVVTQLRKWKFPRALAALTTLLAFFAIFGGIFSAMAPIVRNQGGDLIKQAESGVGELSKLIEQSPINVQGEQVQQVINDVVEFVKGQASNIASGVMTGVSAVSSITVTAIIMLIITFFILKDGDNFVPWIRKYSGPSIGWHATELLSRIWKTLSGFIQTQAIVSFVDAVLIGLGLWALGVPLAFVLAVLTFFAGFIPIIGAVSAGAFAIVIALVSNGPTNALLVLALIVAVQQIEGHILQPILQSRAMGLHAAIVLLSVTVGSTLAGIAGAFLAVPVAATIAVVLRYHAEMVSLRSGEIAVDEIDIVTAGSDNPSSPKSKVRELYETLEPQH